MIRTEERLEDGRRIIYYCFDDEEEDDPASEDIAGQEEPAE